MSVSHLVDSRHRVVFDADDAGNDISYIYNKQTGSKIPVQRNKKVYEINVDVLPYEQAKKVQSRKMTTGDGRKSSFRRPGDPLP